MNDWIKFDEQTPPMTDDPTNPGAKWYEVKLKDGRIIHESWWLNHWYCSFNNGNVEYWRPIEDKP